MAIRINLVTQFDNRGIKQAQRELAAVGRSISTGLNIAVGAGLAAATAGLTSAIKASSDYLAQITGVQQVFGEASKSVEAFAKTAATTAGLSATEALTSAKTFGLFANAAGLGGQAAANFATNLVQLAGDLGSFNEIPTAQVLADISSGLQGQAEPLRKYGVFLTDLKLKEEAKNMAIYNGTGALNDQQKMLASYSLIMKSTTVQQGDFAKYSTDLGNSTKTVTAQLADLSVEIGNAVRPALQEIIPQIQILIPLLGTALKDAVASVDWKTFFGAIITGFKFIIENGQKIATFIGIMFGLTKAFGALKIALDLAAVATGLFRTQVLLLQSTTVLGAAITILGVFAGLMIASQIGVDKETEALKRNIYYQKKFNDEKAKTPGIEAKIRAAFGTQGGNQYIASNYGAGAAGAIIGKADQVVVSGTNVLEDYIKGLGDLGTATKKTSDAAKKAADIAKKAAEEAQKALDDQAEAVSKFNESLTDTVKALGELGKSSKALGQFEQQAVTSFEAINKTVASGLNDKTITQAAADYIYNYIKVEKVALTALARQRDVLLNKIAIAKDISAGFISAANITNTQTKEVTKSVTTMVNGITTTIKTTFDEVLAGDITGAFKKIVDKTKNFAKNLVSLKKLGLNGTLFKQIVDAGAEAGGATAEAIIAGGADTVTELNSLFNELNTAGSQIAETSTDTFYDLGEGISNAFIDGLKSQEQALADEIAKMVASIEAAFASMMARLNTLGNNFGTNANGFAYSSDPMLGGSAESQFGSGTPWAQAVANYQRSQAPATMVNVTVNAGLGTNGKQVGQQIQSLLNQYAKASG